MCGSIIYQGEWNSRNQRDGKGVTIIPGDSVVIGYYKNDNIYGQYLKFDIFGDKIISTI